jgi:hypothetical protein
MAVVRKNMAGAQQTIPARPAQGGTTVRNRAATFGEFKPQMDADEHRWIRKNHEMDRTWTDSTVELGSFYPDLRSSVSICGSYLS